MTATHNSDRIAMLAVAVRNTRPSVCKAELRILLRISEELNLWDRGGACSQVLDRADRIMLRRLI
jgi:hypothetical protein